MTDIKIKHQETFVDDRSPSVNSTRLKSGIAKSKLSEVDIDELFQSISVSADEIELDSVTPLMAVKLLDYLISHLVRDVHSDTKEKNMKAIITLTQHDDPLIAKLVNTDIKGNFEELPTSPKKRLREPTPERVSSDESPLGSDISYKLKKTLSREPSPDPQSTLLAKRFALKAPPKLTSTQYLDRINQYCEFSAAVYLSTIQYIYKLVVDWTLMKLTPLNVHRLIIAALRISCKVVEDINHRQTFIAKIGGVNVKDLQSLELSILFLLKFECQVGKESLKDVINLIRKIYQERNGIE
ncbi:hypothetical protein WICMUC_000403 [Wickerhamomyces mucosus]|uniref:Cyclin-like domain-containing protein n=1 Tax=Wickerhamomyces mucosus TaxID=1378264 RepID=A0A9P8PXW0_9ASCO|nr:hypothetical protein WICMUC_000403 [Wickerhamomyces mucosus]